MFISLAAFCVLVNAAAGAETGGAERRLLELLQEARNWNDPSKQKGLLLVLEGAKLLQAKSCIPVLLDHIDYSPGYISLVTSEMRWPVCYTLSAIGLPAVQPLLDELRIEKPGDRVAGQELLGSVIRRTLTVSSLIALYDAGGHGRELAKARIELEAAKYPGEEGHFLRQALEDRWLRKD